MHDLFVYGTLICEDIMVAVAGPYRRRVPARLADYQRLAVRGEHYPGMVPAAGHAVEGVVYTGIGRRALAALDRFEGGMYRRTVVRVAMADGNRQSAFAYVVKERYRHRLEPRAWDLDAFLREGKSAFIGRYAGFRRS